MARRKNGFDLFGSLFNAGKAIYKESKKQNAAKKKANAKIERERAKLREYCEMQDMIRQGYIFITKRQLEKYKNVIDGELFINLLLSPSPNSKIPIKQEQINALEKELNARRDYEKKLKQCAALNNKGIAFEKDGKIKSAISAYEKNVESGYPALHSYSRLMIIYREQKKYEDEIRVIERSLEVFHDSKYKDYVAKWGERMEKANKLLKK